VALCLENGIVGQGDTQDIAMAKLKEAAESFQLASDAEENVHSSPVPVEALDEFLTVEAMQPIVEIYEFRAVYA